MLASRCGSWRVQRRSRIDHERHSIEQQREDVRRFQAGDATQEVSAKRDHPAPKEMLAQKRLRQYVAANHEEWNAAVATSANQLEQQIVAWLDDDRYA